MILGNIDFSTPAWMSSLVEGQIVTITVDGNVFTITSSGNNVYINGFPVTVDQWNQVISGKAVKLSFQGKEATLTSDGSNIMFNGNSMTTGSSMAYHVSFGQSSSSNTKSGKLLINSMSNFISFCFYRHDFNRELKSRKLLGKIPNTKRSF